MDSRAAIRQSIELADMIADTYLGDLEDSELFIRPADSANHAAWQLGHLICSEHSLVSGLRPGSMPDLPEGFLDKYTKETASIDDPAQFHTKDEYMKLRKEQRAGTLKVLDTMTDADFDEPAPEKFRAHFPTVGSIMVLQGMHTVMHAGQWAVLRRKLGKPVTI
ncbi:DinB superfamily protein [Symmachiella macrocystis]|uniref:DinB superfamily protein n=1 Tax=Symmachiella macrocystis TaxID=2527985 RepID=A0A5C6BTW6_9PLAN|nr:DinB family protein [Symmachiella macrocystis]TWU14154.1 DinB superfamily protein [Symmachiella macrocystis]